MALNDDLTHPPASPATDTDEQVPATSRSQATPTFTSEAESLLKHLRLGAPRPQAPAPAPGGFPKIPDYEIECELGRGGMGVVYKARHRALHHTVAIKMILASAHAAPTEVLRFLAEAEAVAAVKHPNVVQVYHLGNVDSLPYFVMEFVDGGNLSARLKDRGPLDPTQAAELIEAVARGVQAAHDAGIVHRDLKPANILLASGGRNPPDAVASSPSSSSSGGSRPPLAGPKVSDFGLAKRLSSDLTRSQAVMGTPQYMAPEQAGGKAKFVGPQADVYALGAILYECLTGRPPFTDSDPWALIGQVMKDPPPPLRKLAPQVPRDLELICLKCLEKEPHDRYPTAAALADDLLSFLGGEPVSVRPISVFTRVVRWAKKRPAAATLAVLGVLAALIIPPLAVGITGWLERREAVAAEAKQKEAEARRAEAEAKRAEEESHRARVAAEQLADARERFVLQNKFRTRVAERPLGWTDATHTEMPRALALAGGDPQVLEDLRSVAATALLSSDLFPLPSLEKGLNFSAAATDRKTGLVAVGEFKSWGACRVLLIDLATGQTVRQLTYPTVPVVGTSAIDLVQDGTRALAFSPDGKRLFAGTRSSRVVRFDLEKPENTPAMIWKASRKPVGQLAVSPDGKTVYGLCWPEEPLFAWDAETGTARKPFTPEEKGTAFRTFAVLASGDILAGNGRSLYRWKADGTPVSQVPGVPCSRLAPAGGSLLLVANDARLGIHDRDSGELTNTILDPNLRRSTHEESVRTILLHPSGAFFATAAGDSDRTVKVWALASGRLTGTLSVPGTGPIAVAWSGDGTHLLATAESCLMRWRFASADSQRFACFAGPSLDSATFTTGGKVAALGANWNRKRELLIGGTDGRTDAVALADAGGSGQPGLATGPDGMIAITRSAPGITLWKPGGPIPAPKFTREIAACPRLSPDGRTVWAVVGSKTVRTYDVGTAEERGRWNNSIADVVSGLSGLNTLSVGCGGAVAGGRDGSAYLLDASTCALTASFRNSGDPALSSAFAPNDAFAVVGTQNGQLRTVRVADKAELASVSAHPGGVTAIAVNRESMLLATGGRDRSVRLWRWTGDRFEPLLAVFDLPDGVTELQFNPADGRLLVLLANEHAVRVWDLDRLKAQLAAQNLGW